MITELKKPLLLFTALIFIGGSIAFLESRKTDRGSSRGGGDVEVANREDKAERYEPAKEISTPDGFINAENVTVSEFVGEKVVLVDFWTYSCINCQRTLPYLNAWHEKYADQGLVIIGLHTPEFEFEKDYENVSRAVERFGIEYPVVLDNDFSTWRSYKNQYWPRKYLIDIDGFIVYDHIGEGAYDETEEKIVELLNERSRVLGAEDVERDEATPEGIDVVDFSRIGSPEMYFGNVRIRNLVNLPALSCLEGVCEYEKPQDIPLNGYALSGEWKTESERIVLQDVGGTISLRFLANKVNIVAGSEKPIRAHVYIDGRLIESDEAGVHVENGKVTFDAEDLYNLVDFRGSYEEHVLELELLRDGFSAFAFTFG